jgi:uncharacterized membrane protein
MSKDLQTWLPTDLMSGSTFVQIISLVGAVFILIAYFSLHMHWLDSNGATYNLLNAIGGVMLAYVALHPFSAGFLVMETTWTLISLYALSKVYRRGHGRSSSS